MMKNVFLLLALVLGFQAQAQFNWPEDKQLATEKYSLLTEAVKNKELQRARPYFQWLYQEAPDLNKSLYIQGATLYQGLADQATDPKVKMALQDTALLMYDERMKYFGDSANVLNRKGLIAFNYLKDRPNAEDQMYAIYDKLFEKNGANTYAANALPYMYLLCKENEMGNIDDEKVLAGHGQIMVAYDKNVSANKAVEVWDQIKEQSDNLLASCVTIDCDFVRENYGPKFEENPADMELARKIYQYMSQGKCYEDPLFLKASKAVYQEQPTSKLATMIAKLEQRNDNYDEALKYLKEAADQAEGSERGELYLDIAGIYARQGQKSAARGAAQKAAAAGLSKAYVFIGDLYFNSYSQCSGGNPVESRLVYIAAYEQYEKAGASSKMSNAKEQFPSKEELFTYNMAPGQTAQTGCWIGETVTLKTRN